MGPLLKTWLPLMKNLLEPSAKSVLILLELKAVAAATIQLSIRKCLDQVLQN